MTNENTLAQLGDVTELVTSTAHQHIGLVIEQSNKDIGTLMKTFQSLLTKLQDQDKESSATTEIAAILEALQFHDRTTQILTSVQQSLDIYMKAVEKLKNGENIDLQKVNDDLHSHFVVAEQYAEGDEYDHHIGSDKPLFF